MYTYGFFFSFIEVAIFYLNLNKLSCTFIQAITALFFPLKVYLFIIYNKCTL